MGWKNGSMISCRWTIFQKRKCQMYDLGKWRCEWINLCFCSFFSLLFLEGSMFGGAYGHANMPNWPHRHRTPSPRIATLGLCCDKGGIFWKGMCNCFHKTSYNTRSIWCSDICGCLLERWCTTDKRVDNDIRKNILGAKMGFCDKCQGGSGKQPLKVTNPQLRRSMNCGTFLLSNSVFL